MQRRKLFVDLRLDDTVGDEGVANAVEEGVGGVELFPRGLGLEEDLDGGEDLRSVDADDGDEEDDGDKGGEVDAEGGRVSPLADVIDDITEILVGHADIKRGGGNVSRGISGRVDLTEAVSLVKVNGLGDALDALERREEHETLAIRKRVISAEVGLRNEGDLTAVDTNDVVLADGTDLLDDGERGKEGLVKDRGLSVETAKVILVEDVIRRADAGVVDGEEVGGVSVLAGPRDGLAAREGGRSTAVLVGTRGDGALVDVNDSDLACGGGDVGLFIAGKVGDVVVGTNGELASKLAGVVDGLDETALLVVADDVSGLDELVEEGEGDGLAVHEGDFRGRDVDAVARLSAADVLEALATDALVAVRRKEVNAISVGVALVETEGTLVEILARRTISTLRVVVTGTGLETSLAVAAPEGRFSDTALRKIITVMEDFSVGTEL